MINEKVIAEAANAGLPALNELFNKLSKEDALKGIGIMAVLGIGYKVIDTILEIVRSK